MTSLVTAGLHAGPDPMARPGRPPAALAASAAARRLPRLGVGLTDYADYAA